MEETPGSDVGRPVTFCFQQRLGLRSSLSEQTIRQDKIRWIMQEWTQFAPITFEEITEDRVADIQIAFEDDRSWNATGTTFVKPEDPGTATINLGWIKSESRDILAEERALILHEFGHALGMLLERQSPARGDVAVQDPSKAIEYYTSSQGGWSTVSDVQHILAMYDAKDVNEFSQTRTESIMHSPMPAWATDTKRDVPKLATDRVDKGRGSLPLGQDSNSLYAKDESGKGPQGTSSPFVKPAAITEADFRLTDQL